MKQILFAFFTLTTIHLFGQTPDSSWKSIYQETPTKLHSLVHTRLEVKPDFAKQWVYGKAWLTLHPYFYATDSLVLDAKGLDVKKVALIKGNQELPLKYSNDDYTLRIKMDRVYKANEDFIVFIDYTGKPDEFEARHPEGAMLGIKGMFFINPTGADPNMPTQLWTQGETEANSAWFPTIDKTAQKSTEDLSVTVDNKYVTLSNGLLVSQKKNPDGTRTDRWKMDLPHSPYLFFLGVGEYAVVKDSWKGKEVSYYVEKEYEPVARKIFGNTPEMMTFFSKITGVDYPWPKYSQITGRNFVAGAMENTTATLHQSTAQQDARELLDGNRWETTIAHELFHHWFGDYVTAESWSNITLNESWADYSETMWQQYKYGKDAGDAENYKGMQSYMSGSAANLAKMGADPSNANDRRDLVRFHYKWREDVFDAVSYQKGGRILHMLRNYIGDDAFFKGMNLYLTTNKFKAAEAQQLRLAFEEVTGRDLNWFFNQWYYGSGHPSVNIDYVYDDASGRGKVIMKQLQAGKTFRLPFAIDVYDGNKKARQQVWMNNATDTFEFSYAKHPSLVNVDADKILLWEKNDNKTLDNYIAQYSLAGNYVDRAEAISEASHHQDDPKAAALMMRALNDPFHELRDFAVSSLDLTQPPVKTAAQPILVKLAKSDPDRVVRATAIEMLGEYKDPANAELFRKASYDSSYKVAGIALQALGKIDPAAEVTIAKELMKQPAKGELKSVLDEALVKTGDEKLAEDIIGGFAKMPMSSEKLERLNVLSTYLSALPNTDKVKTGIDEIVKFRDAIPDAYRPQTVPYINGLILKGILAGKSQALKADPSNQKLRELVEYIKKVMPEEDKKGF